MNLPRSGWCLALALLTCLPLARADDPQPESPLRFPGPVEAARYGFIHDDWLDCRRITIQETQPGELTLSGAVTDLDSCERAFRLARAWEGVTRVKGRLDIDKAPQGTQIVTPLMKTLRANFLSRAYPVLVEHDAQGVLTLRGELPTCGARDLVLMMAKRVHGVQAVMNDISLRMKPRSDADIHDTIARLFAMQTAADLRAVTVKVKDACVELVGTVPSPADLCVAEHLAGIGGVILVDAGRLKIHWERQAGPAGKAPLEGTSVPASAPRAKDSLKEDIALLLAEDPCFAGVPGVRFEVEVEPGRPVLVTGEVPCLAASRHAEMLVRHVRGVHDLRFRVSQAVTEADDFALNHKVSAIVSATAGLERMRAETAGMRVTLIGYADPKRCDYARELVECIPGVIDVTVVVPRAHPKPEGTQRK
ncbi:MAG: BON domain-containing protein [Planctomycetota bacterium]